VIFIILAARSPSSETKTVFCLAFEKSYNPFLPNVPLAFLPRAVSRALAINVAEPVNEGPFASLAKQGPQPRLLQQVERI
jgi:hypothetical protein